MLKLAVIIVSTRPGRSGPAVATWFHEIARAAGAFEVELVDLCDYELPLFDEPAHPRLRQYQHEHTKRWSETVDRMDAFVFVTPEYNYGTPPSLVNALTYLAQEWHYKPVGFVSYGGVSGGLRAVQMTKQFITTHRMMPIPESVPIPLFTQFIGDDGVFLGSEQHGRSAATMLEELHRWAVALRTLREKGQEGDR